MNGEYQKLPYVTIEVTDLDPAELIEAGLGDLVGLEGLEGWKIFKKVGRWFKKVGRKIKKVKLKSIIKIAAPIVAGVALGPLVGLGFGTLTRKFGGTVAKLVKAGRTIPQKIMTARGPAVALLNSREGKIIKQAVGTLGRTLTDSALQRLIGRNPNDLIAPGADVVDGRLTLPVQGTPVATSETIDARSGFFAQHGKKLIVAGAAVVAVPLIIKMMKK